MRAVQIKKYGERDVLEVVQLPRPTPGHGQVLIEVHAASVNPIDFKLRSGSMKLIHPLRFPAVLGFDLSGVVLETGPGASKFQIGDQVYSRSNKKSGESYAELNAVDEAVVALKPTSLSHAEAAAIPLAALTALQGLRDRGGLRQGSGQRVLINGASGGVGSYAVQIARAFNAAQIVATCSDKNVDFVKSLGADVVIDYRATDPLALTDGAQAYDIIFDSVASLDFGRAKKALRPGGRFVTTVPDGSVMLALAGGNLFSSRKAAMILVKSNGTDLDYLRGLADAGKLRSTIDSTFPLDQIQAAHERSESGRVRGKVVIAVK